MATLPQFTDTSVFLPNYTPPKLNPSGASQVKPKPAFATPTVPEPQNITSIPTSSAMGGSPVSGLAAAGSTPWGIPQLGVQPQAPPKSATPGVGPNLATQTQYRQDAGQYLTDAQYTSWKNQQATGQLGATTGIQTDAQKGLMSQQAQLEAEASARQNSASAAQLAAEQAFQQQMAATQQGYAGQNMTQQAQIQAAAAAQQQQNAIAQMEAEARLRAQASQQQMAYFPQILQQLDASTAGSPTSMGMSPQEEAARQYAFTRAREQAGGTALASLRALGNYAAQQGQTGSSMERNMAGGVIGGAAHDVNDFTGQQMMADVNRASGIADRDYAGNLTRRGQNLSVASNFLNGLRY